MPLKAHMGNRPYFDEDGYVHGAVKNVELITHKEKDGSGEWESLRWTFEAKGTLRPFEFSELSGLSIHGPDEKSGELNKLTSLVVKLGILTLEDITSDALPDHDLESAIGLCVAFKIYRKDGFYRVDVATLHLDDNGKSRTAKK